VDQYRQRRHRHLKQRITVARRTITKALREMRKQRLATHRHAPANYAGIARTSM
jgi:hypothetical protein